MTSKDAIKWLLETNQNMMKSYLSDLSDADLLIRPAPTANHIAWQIGHLINSEAEYFGRKFLGTNPPALPEGFAAQHGKEMSTSDTGFRTKEEYLALYNGVRNATKARLAEMPDADLDKPSGWREIAPTMGALFMMVANHDMMHVGQFTVVRRKLGKPVLM